MAAMLAPVTTKDRLDIVPERVLDPMRRKPLAARLGVAFGDGFLSFVLNAAVVAWLIQIGWPPRSTASAPDPISVEIVDHMPGETKTASKGQEPEAAAKSAETSGTVQKPSTEPARPETAESSGALAKPQGEAPSQEPVSEPRPNASAGTPEEKPNPETPPSAAAVPPPPEQPDNEARPQLVEAPKAPERSATQVDTNTPATQAPPDPAEVRPAPAGPQPRQPGILSSPTADEALPVAAPQPEKPPALTAEQKHQAENTAKLAAVLPFSQSITADPFQSRINGQGTANSEAYRGAVYGAFAKANAVVEDARARHLRGQAVVAFTLDDQGGLAALAIAVSSGHPDVDQAALDFIRRSAPYPPPPPGAQRSFSPAIGFGLDE